MIGILELSDSLVYNGIDTSIKESIISASGTFIVDLEKENTNMDGLLPIDTKPIETKEEYDKLIDSLSD